MTITLFDLSGIFRQNWHASEQDEIGSALRKTVGYIHAHTKAGEPTGICIDSPPYKRREIDPNYKAQRDKAPEAMHEQLRGTIAQLDADGYHIFGAPGYEADDIIATLCAWAKGKQPVLVYSADKDLLQLVSDYVHVISTATAEEYDHAAVIAKFGVAPVDIPDLLALMGDKSDNIPGIKGVGPKTAAGWMHEHGDLDGVLKAAAGGSENLGRFTAVVADSAPLIRTWRKLTQLAHDAPIKPEEIMQPKEPKQQEPQSEMRFDEPAAEQAEPTRLPTPENMPAVPQTALVATASTQVAWERALEPRDIGAAWKLAQGLYKSRMFGEFPTPEGILAVVLTGRAFGMDAVASLRGFQVIKNRVCASSQLLIGQVKKHPQCEYFQLVKSTPEIATWRTKRQGDPEPTEMSFTVAEAKAAGMFDGRHSDQWGKDTANMLRWRAGVRLARVVYPDVLSGLYAPEEMGE